MKWRLEHSIIRQAHCLDSLLRSTATLFGGPVLAAAIGLAVGPAALAAEIALDLAGGYVDEPIVLVYAGDTVTWTARLPGSTEFVRSYGGEFSSPPLTNGGPAFAFTFTNAGFFAYKTGTLPGGMPAAGSVTALPLTGARPAVTVNTPLDGFIFPSGGTWGPSFPIQVSLTNSPDKVREVDILTNGVMIASLAAAPYRLTWTAPVSADAVAITARVREIDGKVYGSAPVTVGVRGNALFLPAHRLSGGQFVFYYSAYGFVRTYILYRDRAEPAGSPPLWNGVWQVEGYGVFVDELAAQSPRRYYTIMSGEFAH